MSEPKRYFKGDDLDKAIEWLKEYIQSSDVTAEVEGTLLETGARVSFSGLVIDAESGFGKTDKVVVRLDKKPRWTSEQMVAIGKPDVKKEDAEIATEEVFFRLKIKAEHAARRASHEPEHRRRTTYRSEHRDHHDD